MSVPLTTKSLLASASLTALAAAAVFAFSSIGALAQGKLGMPDKNAAPIVRPAGQIGTIDSKAQLKTAHVPLSQIASALRDTLDGTEVLLNNYHRGSGTCVEQTSHVKLGKESYPFDIPVFKEGPGGLTLVSAYIYSMKSQGLTVTPVGDHIVLTLSFESKENEIKVFAGNCGSDALPDLNMNSAKIEVKFGFDKFGNGDISIASPSAAFDATVYGHNVPAFIERMVKTHVKDKVKSILEDKLNAADTRALLAVALRLQVLEPAHIGAVQSVRVVGGNLEIKHIVKS